MKRLGASRGRVRFGENLGSGRIWVRAPTVVSEHLLQGAVAAAARGRRLAGTALHTGHTAADFERSEAEASPQHRDPCPSHRARADRVPIARQRPHGHRNPSAQNPKPGLTRMALPLAAQGLRAIALAALAC
jgi:hypothetical protein